MQVLWGFFAGSGFMPHAHCYLWKPELMLLHGGSDLLIALSYFTIPVTMAWVASQRKNLPFRWLFAAFIVFILACGLGHLLEVFTLWQPIYWLSGTSKAVTAVVSVVTAAALVRFAPDAVRAPTLGDLRRAQDRFRAFADGSLDGFFLLRHEDGRFAVEYANSAGLDLVGVTLADDVVGRSLDRLLLGDASHEITDLKRRAVQSGQTQLEELDLRLVDGRQVTLQIQVVPFDEGVGVTVRDVTERVRNSTRLRLLADVIASTDDAVITADLQRRVTSWNPGAERMLGYAESEVLGRRPFAELVPVDDRDPSREELTAALDGRTPPMRETTRQAKDGSQVPVSVRVGPLRDDRDGVVGAFGILRDLSDSRQAEALRVALAEREVLLHEIHHRVKNDLQLVSSLLRKARRSLPPQAHTPVRLAIERIRVIAQVHDQLYTAPRMDRIELSVYLDRLVSSLRGLAPEGVQLSVTLSTVSVTAGQAIATGLIVHELVVNAFEHAFPAGRSGSVALRVRHDTQQGQVVLEAEDDGVPIDVGERGDLVLIRALAEQVGGTLTWTTGTPKCITVTYPSVVSDEAAE